MPGSDNVNLRKKELVSLQQDVPAQMSSLLCMFFLIFSAQQHLFKTMLHVQASHANPVFPA